MSNLAILLIASPIKPFKLIALTVFTKHKDLILGTLGLATNNDIIMDNAICIWAYKQLFLL